MHKLTILIPTFIDQSRFDAGWPEFLHWAEQMPGLRKEVTSRVTNVLYGDQDIWLIHELIFDDRQAAVAAMESPAGQSAGQTLQTISQGRLTLLFADHLEDSVENIRRTRGPGPDPEKGDLPAGDSPPEAPPAGSPEET